MNDPLTACVVLFTAAAPMMVDGDTVRGSNLSPDVRLTGEGNTPHDTPETWRPGCERERLLGEQAERAVRDLLRENGGGVVCVLKRGRGGAGRDLGVLYIDQGGGSRDVMEALRGMGLARKSDNHDWCKEG